MKDGLIEKVVTRKVVLVDEDQYPSDLLAATRGQTA